VIRGASGPRAAINCADSSAFNDDSESVSFIIYPKDCKKVERKYQLLRLCQTISLER
jgi:hypothetical protein